MHRSMSTLLPPSAILTLTSYHDAASSTKIVSGSINSITSLVSTVSNNGTIKNYHARFKVDIASSLTGPHVFSVQVPDVFYFITTLVGTVSCVRKTMLPWEYPGAPVVSDPGTWAPATPRFTYGHVYPDPSGKIGSLYVEIFPAYSYTNYVTLDVYYIGQ